MIDYKTSNIRKLREAKGLSQSDVAQSLNMGAGSYAKIERGENGMNVTRLKQLADIFEVDIVQLLEDDDQGLICFIKSGNFSGNIGNNSENNHYSGDSTVEIGKLNLIIEHQKQLLKKEQQRVIELEQWVEQKNTHIEALQSVIAKLEKDN
ncbi:MAG: hypothetical protein CR974_03550 [Gammaproteobacteria bacterium]|nr:MAG: hypothetical protein CR974_03550 [Gammaproteobacteria bacterium]